MSSENEFGDNLISYDHEIHPENRPPVLLVKSYVKSIDEEIELVCCWLVLQVLRI